MLALPRRPNRQRIALGSSARLSQLHLGSSQLGLNALQCDASDGVICGRAALQRRLRGQSRKLSLPVMSRAEAASIEIGDGLAQFGGGGAVPDADTTGPARFRVGSPLHPRRPAPAGADSGGSEGAEPAGAEDERADQAEAEPAEADSAPPPADPTISKRVFAGNLPFTASKSRLWDLFEQFGKVMNVHIVKAPHNGKSRGFGFITFREEDGAQNALAADGSPALSLLSRQIRVSPAEPREQRPPSARSRAGRAAALAARRSALPEPRGPCHADRLPAELLQLVLSHLELPQLLAAQRVSRRWRDAARDLLRRRPQLDLRALPSTPGGGPARLTDRTLRHMLRLMPALRVLRTGGNVRSCSYKALDIVASHCKQLVEIELDGFCISEDSLKRLCVACPLLEEVRLPSHYHFSEASVWVLLRHLPALRTLELNSSDRVTGRCFSLLPASLRRLSAAGCSGLRSEALRQVGRRCPELRQLDVSGVPELAAGDLCAALTGCPQLERLTLRRTVQPLERCLPAPAGLPQLRHLDVGAAAGVTDGTLRQLPDLLPALHTLNIQGCPSVTEEGLYHLRRLKQLLSLDLSYLRCVSDAALDKLHSAQLKQLHLAEGYSGSASFTDQGAMRLVLGCPSLTLLDLSCVEDVTADLVDLLFRQLPKTRDVTLYVGGTLLQELPPPPAGPLRLQDVNTVPLHMRGIIDDLYDYDSDQYDYEADELADYYYGIDIDDFDDFDPADPYYDYGYEDEWDEDALV